MATIPRPHRPSLRTRRKGKGQRNRSVKEQKRTSKRVKKGRRLIPNRMKGRDGVDGTVGVRTPPNGAMKTQDGHATKSETTGALDLAHALVPDLLAVRKIKETRENNTSKNLLK